MKKKILFLLILFIPFMVSAYELEIDWQKSWGGNADDSFDNIFQLKDGNYLVIGETGSNDIENLENHGGIDIVFLKYNKNGNLIWHKIWGGNGEDLIDRIYPTNDEGFLAIVSYTSTNIEELPKLSEISVGIIKFDKEGNIEWKKPWGGSNYNSIRDIKILENDSCIIAGTSNSVDIEGIINNGGLDAIITKIDNKGNFLDLNDIQFIGILSNEDIILSSSSSNKSNGITYYQFSLVRYDKNGTYISSVDIQNAGVIRVSSEDDVYIISDGGIFKYNLSGNKIWEHIPNWVTDAADDSFYDEYPIYKDSIILNDDSIIVIGELKDGKFIEKEPGAVIRKFDKNGKILWENILTSEDIEDTESPSIYFYQIIIKNNKNMVLLGTSSNNNIIIELDESGIPIFKKIIPNMGEYVGQEFKKIIYVEDEDCLIVIGTAERGYPVVFSTALDNKYGGPSISIDAFILKMSFIYTLENPTVENGTSTVEQQGLYGIVKPTPNEGYEVDKVIVKDKSGNVLDVEVTKQEDGTYSFDLYTDVSVEVLFKEKLVNPKTGVSSFIGVMFTLMLIGISSFFMIKNCNNSYEL